MKSCLPSSLPQPVTCCLPNYLKPPNSTPAPPLLPLPLIHSQVLISHRFTNSSVGLLSLHSVTPLSAMPLPGTLLFRCELPPESDLRNLFPTAAASTCHCAHGLCVSQEQNFLLGPRPPISVLLAPQPQHVQSLAPSLPGSLSKGLHPQSHSQARGMPAFHAPSSSSAYVYPPCMLAPNN